MGWCFQPVHEYHVTFFPLCTQMMGAQQYVTLVGPPFHKHYVKLIAGRFVSITLHDLWCSMVGPPFQLTNQSTSIRWILLFVFCLRWSWTFFTSRLQVLLLEPKLQALVYDILPSTTAIFSYAIGSRQLSANEQFFFVGAQTVVSLLQTTQNDKASHL